MISDRKYAISALQHLSRAGAGVKTSLCLAAAVLLVGCGGGGASETSSAVAVVPSGGGSLVPTPTPSPSPTPSPTPSAASTVAATLSGLDPIASGINVSDYLQKSWGTGAIPSSNSPDVIGAFRFVCTPSHNAYDDPVVFPGQPGKSHLHTFFGNTLANANSTYASLRTSGESTCNNLLNRSAYWIPAMMTPAGKVVMPNYVTIYYKRRPDTDPECQHEGLACIALPRGLRYIFGYNMSNPANSSVAEFVCNNNNTVTGPFKTIPEAAKGCPNGAMLGARLTAPSCWDGKNLDSADHRSHMAFPSYGDWGYEKCPADHPYIVPTFSLAAWYMVDDSIDRSGDMSPTANTWYLASDRMAGMPWQTPGTTMHADWFGAWEDSVIKTWTDNCINLLLSCTGGDLGNGTQIKTTTGYNWATTTQLVDPPAKS